MLKTFININIKNLKSLFVLSVISYLLGLFIQFKWLFENCNFRLLEPRHHAFCFDFYTRLIVYPIFFFIGLIFILILLFSIFYLFKKSEDYVKTLKKSTPSASIFFLIILWPLLNYQTYFFYL